jgi:hypothetical protein
MQRQLLKRKGNVITTLTPFLFPLFEGRHLPQCLPSLFGVLDDYLFGFIGGYKNAIGDIHDLTRPTRALFRFHLTLVLLHYRAY